MTVRISCVAGAAAQFFDNNGVPLAGGLIYTYTAGTSTPATTYTSVTGLIANSNPIVLDSAGRTPQEIWFTQGASYKFVLRDSAGSVIGTYDNLVGVNDLTVILADLALPTGSSLVGFIQAGTGAVARTVQSKLRETCSIVDYGADPTGVANSGAAIQAALQSGAQSVYVPPGTYSMTSNISATISTDVTFYGHGTIIYTGSTGNTNPLIAIETGNNTLTIDGLSFDGADKIAAGIRVYNTATPSSNTVPNCTVSNNFFIRFRMTVAGIWNQALYVAGSFQLVTIANNRIRLITRAAGTGTPSSSGTAGIEVTPYSTSQFIRECMHYGNQYAAISGDDLITSPNCVDYDGFKFFAPSPAAASGQYAQSTLTSFGNIFRNCRGRAMKIQAIGSVRDETIIRDDANGVTIFGGSSEINFQFGVGMVSNCQFIYRDYGSPSSSPIQTGLVLVSFYQGSDYGEDTGSCIVNGLQVLSSIPAGLGVDIGSIVGATVGAGVATPLKPLISISNVSINKNAVYAIVNIGYEATTYGTLRLDNITVPKLNWSAVTTNGTDTNFDIIATNVLNVDGLATPANAKPFVTTSTGTPTAYVGQVGGVLNQGFLTSYANSSSNNKSPLLFGGGLSGDGANGGATSIQSTSLADDATFEFAERFYNSTRGVFVVSVNYDYTTQAVFVTGSNAIYSVAAPAGSLFEVSTAGTNPDVDGKFNMWYTGGKLNVKNRLGDSYVVTVNFIG
jgi:hypothetical protein